MDPRLLHKVAMDPRLWHKVAALSGMAALGLGTYAALVAAPINNRPNIFGGLLTAGILAFSGTLDVLCYVLPLICNPSLFGIALHSSSQLLHPTHA
ncbi:hypothetical protein F0562_011269 [Nyssa sinensis]|uniref:Uncharacterized protein n=1 Tax=Nyssa sinensis TaxID=561372 RepID=A0A5J5A4A2_9ASTE|nr:hypothetical protein F0562_011269 [Nyssa sinensis]